MNDRGDRPRRGFRAKTHALLAIIPLLIAACGGGSGASATTGQVGPTPTSPVGVGSTAAPASGAPATPAAPAAWIVLVDTDVAPDDLVALAFLLSAPNVTVAAITVSGTGEARCDGGVRVVLGLLEYLQAPDIPVACGRGTPLAASHAFPDAWRDAADAGSGLELPPTERKASGGSGTQTFASIVAASDHPTILTLGPLTNLADALAGDPTLASRLGPVIVMGGALHVPGNLRGPGAPVGNTVAEWNVYVDPHAAQIVIASGLHPSFVSLDGTSQVPVTVAFAQRAIQTAATSAAGVLAQLLTANPFMADGSYYLWDPLAAELAAGYPVGAFTPATVTVEEAEGAESGFTRPTTGDSNIGYLATVDATAAEETLLAVLNAP
jgi:inosine-uridine nucleoside N-ribohydrolase